MKPTFTPTFFMLSLLFALFTGTAFTGPAGLTDTNTNCTLTNETSTSFEESCYPPSWTNTYNILHNSATWQWESCYGASGYHIQWRYPGGGWYDVNGVCYQTWYQMEYLNPCTSYEWRVRSYCSYGYYSSWCYPYSFTTLCNSCSTPYGCYTDDITEHSATFHWNNVWGAQNYSVQIQDAWGNWTNVPNSPCYDNWITVYNLQPNTYYGWRVRAHCGNNYYSDWTYNTYFTTYGSQCHYPSWLSCYDITDHTATWKWDPVYEADYYTIQWRNSGGTWYDLSTGPVYGTWVNVYHLNPCTTYEYRVRSHCHYGYSSWCYPYSFTTDCHSYCPSPNYLTTKDIGDTKATFKWGPVQGAYTYSVQIRSHYGQWIDVPGSPTAGIWITAYNLSPCTSYEWRIRTNCGHYESSSNWSAPQYFMTTCGHGCYAPEYVYTSGITSSSAALHWGTVIGATHYEVEWRKPGQDWTVLAGGPWTGNVAEIGGLDPHTTYEWRVRAYCSTGNYSSWSSITYFTTTERSCGYPFFRYTHPVTDSTATFNWSAVAGATSYAVQYRTLNGDWITVPGSPTTETSITVSGLLPNTAYEWRMQVTCVDGTGSWLAALDFNTGIPAGCATPGDLNAENVTLTSALLTWSEVPNAASYSVEYRALPNGPWILIPGSEIDTNFVQLDNLNPHTTYEWRVRTNCVGGLHSFYSAGVHFTTTDLPPCPPPSGLVTDTVTETTATLSWSAVTGAVGYNIEIRLPNGAWVQLDSLVTDTSFTIQGLKKATAYELRIRSKCGDQQYSQWSAAIVFTTAGSTSVVVNDECAHAISLSVDTTCLPTLASNVDATESSPATMGGCSSVGHKDVWFKFTMPDVANPMVTIRTTAGTLSNAVMEVYSGTTCEFLSLITCEDNNDNGNGSTMPVVTISGTANATIYVRVWGLEGSTGSFSICVFDFVSMDFTGRPVDIINADAGEDLTERENHPIGVRADHPQLMISPNPVSDRLKVQVELSNNSKVLDIRMIDLSGKVMGSWKAPGDQATYNAEVDVISFVPGMYLLQVQTTEGIITEKVMVVR